jgi:prevent-host-death family protein
MEVGVRAFRDQLSRWLEAVRKGQEVVITDRGRPIARLIPVDGMASIDRLVSAGAAERPRDRAEPAAARPRVRVRRSVSELVAEQRR